MSIYSTFYSNLKMNFKRYQFTIFLRSSRASILLIRVQAPNQTYYLNWAKSLTNYVSSAKKAMQFPSQNISRFSSRNSQGCHNAQQMNFQNIHKSAALLLILYCSIFGLDMADLITFNSREVNFYNQHLISTATG